MIQPSEDLFKIQSMRVLFLITARGGSKGLPGKNLLKLDGISLVGFKALSAHKSRYCSRLIISTDSPEIQGDARQYGVEVPFTRPAELATDTASSVDVIWHALEYLETQGEPYDAVMLLEPSAPFATHDDYDRAIEMMIAKQANVVVGVRAVTVNSVFQGPLDAQLRLASIVDKIQHQRTRRQDQPHEYTMNGALYLFRWDFFKKHRQIYGDRENTYGYIMPQVYSLEIDEAMDYVYAQFMIERGYIDLSYWKDVDQRRVDEPKTHV